MSPNIEKRPGEKTRPRRRRWMYVLTPIALAGAALTVALLRSYATSRTANPHPRVGRNETRPHVGVGRKQSRGVSVEPTYTTGASARPVGTHR